MVAIRPTSLDDDFIGLVDVREVLGELCEAAESRHELPGHVLITGGAGRGKTQLAGMVAARTGAPFHDIDGTAVKTPPLMIAWLRSIEPGDVRFLDEIHAVAPRTLVLLYRALEDGCFSVPGEIDQVKLPPFMLIAATTDADQLTDSFRGRFDLTVNVTPYAPAELAEIVTRGAERLLYAIDADAAQTIGLRSRGTPREALRLMRRARDAARGREVIELEHVLRVMKREGIDHLGLNRLDRRVLRAVAVHFVGEAIGIDPLVTYIDDNDAKKSIKYLQRIGLLLQTRRGQVATRAAYVHLGLRVPVL